MSQLAHIVCDFPIGTKPNMIHQMQAAFHYCYSILPRTRKAKGAICKITCPGPTSSPLQPGMTSISIFVTLPYGVPRWLQSIPLKSLDITFFY